MTSPHPPTPGMIRLTRLIYALHALTAFFLLVRPGIIVLIRTGIIITLLILSLPSLAAIVLNYWKRSAVRGTWLDSHFGWQIRTFWWTLAGVTIAFMLIVTLPFVTKAIDIVSTLVINATGINMPITFVIISAWITYRVVRGGWRLANGQPMPTPLPPIPCDTEACMHADGQPMPSLYPPTPGMIRLTYLIYALHALAVFFLLARLGPTRPGIILLSLPPLTAIVLNYWKRSAVRGTWLDSHFGWQIRTFWWALGWIAIVPTALKLPFVGDALLTGYFYMVIIPIMGIIGNIFISIFMALIITIFFTWVIYRVVRGWRRLSNRQPMPEKHAVCTLPHKPCPPRTDPEIS